MKKSTGSIIHKITAFIEKYYLAIFIAILFLGLYLRFHNIEVEGTLGFDQARDAWKTRDILKGNFQLQGPWTGNGHIHIGPAFFYLLAPFFWLTNLDPIGAQYLNFILNILNFTLIYFVMSRFFGKVGGLFAVLAYSLNAYQIELGRTPWNVTPMPGVAALLFYSVVKTAQGHSKWILLVATLAGLYFHLHFTAIFLPVIILLSFVVFKNKKQLVKYIIPSLILYLIWFVPTIAAELMGISDRGNYRDFIKYLTQGFHLRFFLYRAPEAFIQFQKLFTIMWPKILAMLIPLLYVLIVMFKEKDKKEKTIAYLMSVWFIVPMFAFTIYSGSTSEYYYLYTLPMVYYVLIYLQKKIIHFFPKAVVVVLVIFWAFNFYDNSWHFLTKKPDGGLKGARASVRSDIKQGKTIPFGEGNPNSYLYMIWMEDGKRW